ncbi:MAG TPA: 2'-5' RNA ligase family protein [Candidatus Saccharimonadales bacterium]
MARPGSLMVVHMLEPQMVGSYFDRHRWPLHITLLPWLDAAQDQHIPLRQSLVQVALTQPPVVVTAGDVEQFGAKQSVPVNGIAEAGALQPLHQALLDAVRLLDLPMQDTTHVGPAFRPHVTRYADRYVNLGDKLHINDFYLVKLEEGSICQILARFELKAPHA